MISRPTTAVPACVSRVGMSAMRVHVLAMGSYMFERVTGPALPLKPPNTYSFPSITARSDSARTIGDDARVVHVIELPGTDVVRVPSTLLNAELPAPLYARTR